MVDQVAAPSGHTPEGGVLVGDESAKAQMLIFEDPQCPYCRQFEERNGDFIESAIKKGTLAVEYRMRCFLGPESVRADNALALAAEEGRFDELRRVLFANQPEEGTGGFTLTDLLQLGSQAGLVSEAFVSGVKEARYEDWVEERDEAFDVKDSQGTPAAWLNGHAIDSRVLFDPSKLQNELRKSGVAT